MKRSMMLTCSAGVSKVESRQTISVAFAWTSAIGSLLIDCIESFSVATCELSWWNWTSAFTVLDLRDLDDDAADEARLADADSWSRFFVAFECEAESDVVLADFDGMGDSSDGGVGVGVCVCAPSGPAGR